MVSKGGRRVTIEFLGKDTSVGKTSDEVASKVKKTGDAAEKAGPQFDGLGDKVKGFAVGVAATFGGLAIGDLFSQAMNFQSGNAKLTAELGLTKTQSAAAGKAAGSLFSQNYGDSMEQVQEAIGSVIQNIDGMRGANQKTLQDISMRALNTANIFDQDLGGVTRAVSQLLRTGLAKNAKQAFDIITVGFQRGADKSEDFLDTLNEYGTQFRKLGLNGKQATGLISQGLRAGARDGDLVADALKEFSIRAIDGSDATRQGFKQIGVNAKEMAEQIGKGGPAARKGLDTVLDRLRKMKDPVKQAAAATSLFGTQSEDLGKALFALDPSKAVKGLGQVAGVADKANKALNDTPQAKMQAFFRQLQGGAIKIIGGDVIPKLESLGKFIKSNKEALGFLVSTIGGAVLAWKAWTIAQAALNFVMTANPIGLVVVAIATLAAGLVYAYKHSETFRKIVNGAFSAVSKAASFMWNNVLKPTFKFLINAWLAVAGAIVHGAANAFGWVPGLGPKLKAAARNFDTFKERVNNQINGIHNPKIKVTTPGADTAISNLKTIKKLIHDVTTSAPHVKGGGGPLTQLFPTARARAAGGPVSAGQPYVVGERRAELFVPNQNGRIVPRVSAGGSQNFTVTAPLVLKLDSGVVWKGLLKVKRDRGGVSLGLA